MKALLKSGREEKQLKTREVSELLKIDQALISKFENGLRRPTKEQLLKLARLYEIDEKRITILWLKEKFLAEISGEEYGIEAISQLVNSEEPTQSNPDPLEKLLNEVDALRDKIEGIRKNK